MRNANILKLFNRKTCSVNEVLTIKRAASSAVGLFHDDRNVDDLDLPIQRNAETTRREKEKRTWETKGTRERNALASNSRDANMYFIKI